MARSLTVAKKIPLLGGRKSLPVAKQVLLLLACPYLEGSTSTTQSLIVAREVRLLRSCESLTVAKKVLLLLAHAYLKGSTNMPQSLIVACKSGSPGATVAYCSKKVLLLLARAYFKGFTVAKLDLVRAIDGRGSLRGSGFKILKDFAAGLIDKCKGSYLDTRT